MDEAVGDDALDGSVGADIDEYLFYLITQVQNRRTREFSRSLEGLGLSLSHWRALSTINRLDGCLMSELAEFTTVDRTTLTRTVDHLVESGLAVRCSSPQDRRLVRVTLTDAGRAAFAEAVSALNRFNVGTLAGLSAEELRQLRSILQRILRNIVPDPELFRQVVTYSR